MGDVENSLDLDTLNELKVILEEGLNELLEEYLNDSPRQLAGLRQAVEAHDTLAIRSHAHTLKGSSGNLGIRHLYQLCANLEKQARKGDVADPEAAYTAIEAEYERARLALEAFMTV